MSVVRKVTVAKAAGDDLEFVLSDETKDRYGDVIKADGWDLSNFKKNPIALFNHDSRFPIGRWEKVRVEGKKLIGRLKLAAEGTSDRIDEIIRLVEQGVLRAVSVGFQPIEREALADNSGLLFKRQELLETSLVSVPANPSAVQLARSLGTSAETISLVFGATATEGESVVRRSTGATAANAQRNGNMNAPLAQRIEHAQARLVALKDQLTDHINAIGDEPDDAALTVTDELNSKIAGAQRALESLQSAERQLASSSSAIVIEGRATEQGGDGSGRRPWALPAKKVKPGEHSLRALVGIIEAHVRRDGTTPEQVIARRYGEDGKFAEETKILLNVLRRSEGVNYLAALGVQRAASAPADTTTSGWASQLVETDVAEFMSLLMPASVYPGLSGRGLRLNFGRAGVISIPTRSATPTIAGSFVGQGAPIPVRQGAFTSQTLTPKKMAVISVFTREIAEHSNPSIEALIRNAIQEDTSVALDTVLLDANAATTIRPAGLRNGVTVTTATAGGGFAALVGDIKGLVGALVTATNGNIRAPVWLMNPVQALSISLTQNAGGDFPFKQEINGNMLQGYPVIQSSTVPAGMVILVDGADFVSTEGDAPMFNVSDQATLHMEDTTPLAIGTAGAPNTVAAPVRSLFQTDSIALRMLMDVNWALRRTGVVAWTQAVTW